MPDLYVANCTKQDHDFIYLMVDNRSRVQRRIIPQGGQVKFTGLGTKDVEATLEHHRRYGARDLSEVKRERSFVGIVYSDKEIKLSGIEDALAHNIDKLNETGAELRRAASVAADQSLLAAAPEGSTLKATNVELVEVVPKDQPNRDQAINQQIKVTPKPNEGIDRRGRQKLGQRR